jgi:putative NADH-flavin reductase
MRVLVLGATGGIGNLLLEFATARGHEVTAFVRSPQKIALKSERLRVVPGDLLHAEQLAQVLLGQDVVLSAFGPATLRRVTTRGEFGTALATAMERSGVRRAVVVSSGLLFEEQNTIGKLLRGTFFRNLLPDMTAMEATLEKDGLEWTIVRPPRLTNGPLTKELQCGRWAPAEGDDRLAGMRCRFHDQRSGAAGTRAADCGSVQIEFVTRG